MCSFFLVVPGCVNDPREKESHASVATGAHWTRTPGGAEADGGVHDVAAVARSVAHEAARVAAAGVAGDAVGAHQGVGSGGKVGIVEEARGTCGC